MAETVVMPALGLNMQEATFLQWTKEVGQPVKAGDVIAEVEADKATIEVESPFSGVLTDKLVSPGDVIKVGEKIALIGAAGEPAPAVAAPEPVSVPGGTPNPAAIRAALVPVTDGNLPGGVKASPLARRMAEERGIDLTHVRGTGPGGRITKSDVEAFTPAAAAPAAPVAAPDLAPTAPAPTAIPSPQYGNVPSGPDVVVEPVGRMRARIAQRTTESKQQTPHFYLTAEVDMAPALALRKQINEGLPEAQKVTVNDLIVKAVALTLRKFPNLNSHFYGDKIVRHQRINIGIAVALEGGGLINVVAKDADSVSISRLAQRNKEMVANARAGKIKPEDVEGSTFTVSNLGLYDIEHFEAIINPPEAAILAVASARQVPVVVNGEITIGTRMKVSLSVDHRVSDGAEGAEFLKHLRELIEQPMRLLV